MQFQFKPLELKPQGNRIQRITRNPRFKVTLRAILIGAGIGFAFYYLTAGRLMESMPLEEILQSIGVGAFFGFFITNSPCARGRC